MTSVQSTATLSTLSEKPTEKAADKQAAGGFCELLDTQVERLPEEGKSAEQAAEEAESSAPEADVPDMLVLSKLTGRKPALTEEGLLTTETTIDETEPVNEELAMSILNPSNDGLGEVKHDLMSKKPAAAAESPGDKELATKIFEHPEWAEELTAEQLTGEAVVEDSADAGAVIVPFVLVPDGAEAGFQTTGTKGKTGKADLLSSMRADAVPTADNVLPWDRLSPDTMQPDGASTVIPLMQAQANRVLNPLNRRETTPEELVIAALGERDGVHVNQVARQAPDMPSGVLQADALTERVMRVEQLSSRFGEQVLSMVQQNEKVMKLTVQPAALGQLTVMVREENQQMTVEIHSQSEAVRELITRQEDAIRRLLQTNNVDLGKFDVLLKDPSGNPREQLAEGRRSEQQPGRGIGPASKESVEPSDSPTVKKSNAASWVA